jgi:hypothetical protein
MKRVPVLLLLFQAGVFSTTFEMALRIDGAVAAESFSEEDCASAFNALPPAGNLTDGARPSAAKDAFIRYDRACFRKWGDLKENSRRYLATTVGSIFDRFGKPYCTATRIKSDVIMTAAHCPMDGASFRLLGYPSISLAVVSSIVFPGPPADDLDDVALWKIEDNNLPFEALAVSRDFPAHQKIAIVAISLVPFLLERDNPGESWLSSVRWSPVKAAQTWPPSEVSPPLPDGGRFSECVFHKMPTFPGMSGAPILGISRVGAAGEPPRIFVVGIHLRDGATPSRAKSCGVHSEYNVGIKIPASIIQRLRS